MRANGNLFATNRRMRESNSRGAERHFLRMHKGNTSNHNKFCPFSVFLVFSVRFWGCVTSL